MQAGLTRRRLTLREIFSSRMVVRAVEECSIRALRLGPVRQRSCLANASGGLATLDDGSTYGGLPSLVSGGRSRRSASAIPTQMRFPYVVLVEVVVEVSAVDSKPFRGMSLHSVGPA